MGVIRVSTGFKWSDRIRVAYQSYSMLFTLDEPMGKFYSDHWLYIVDRKSWKRMTLRTLKPIAAENGDVLGGAYREKKRKLRVAPSQGGMGMFTEEYYEWTRRQANFSARFRWKRSTSRRLVSVMREGGWK